MRALSVLELKSETYCMENVQINARKTVHFIIVIKSNDYWSGASEFKAVLLTFPCKNVKLFKLKMLY